MAHDIFDLDIPQPPPSELRPFPQSLPPPPAAPRNPRRHMVLAGVAGACVMGAGLGLWARPAEGERQANVQALMRPQPAVRQMRQLQIVVGETPTPVGPPMEVMRAVDTATLTLEPTQPEAEPAAEPAPEPVAPTRPPAGLVRVLTTPLPRETVDLAPAPKRAEPAVRKAETKTVEVRKVKAGEPAAPKPQKKQSPAKDLRVAKAPKPAGEKIRKAKAEAEKTGKVDKSASKLAGSKSDRKADAVKLAKADRTGKGEKAASIAKAEKAGKVSKAEKSKLAAAERARAEKAKAGRLELAAKAEKLKLAETKAKAAKAKSAKPKVEKAEVAPVRKPAPAPAKGAGPLRMVSNSCASADVAENLVCADPSLGAADRRLARAYRQAEAAGVSAAELRRQQQRWLAARAAAAREAPWAVQDVYQARIAELEDLTREAGY